MNQFFAHTKRTALCALLTAAALSGCTNPTRGFDTTTNDGLYTVHWNTTNGQDIVVDDYFIVRARVTPEPRNVAIDAGMPDHRHGMLHQPSMQHLSHDTWLAKDMLFHMPGLWRVQFDITDDQGVVHRAQSAIVLE
jgi:hypothetical protein